MPAFSITFASGFERKHNFCCKSLTEIRTNLRFTSLSRTLSGDTSGEESACRASAQAAPPHVSCAFQSTQPPSRMSFRDLCAMCMTNHRGSRCPIPQPGIRTWRGGVAFPRPRSLRDELNHKPIKLWANTHCGRECHGIARTSESLRRLWLPLVSIAGRIEGLLHLMQ